MHMGERSQLLSSPSLPPAWVLDLNARLQVKRNLILRRESVTGGGKKADLFEASKTFQAQQSWGRGVGATP